MLSFLKSAYDVKQIMRNKMMLERKSAYQQRPDASVHAARLFLDHIPFSKNHIIGLYHPISEELSTQPLIDELFERGIKLTLPVVEKKKEPLLFREYTPETNLQKGRFKILVPPPTSPAYIPDIIVTPLLAFHRRGMRLGYGGGFYDRTLEKLRENGNILAVGYGFGAQEVDDLPHSPLDQPLDWIITEREAIKI